MQRFVVPHKSQRFIDEFDLLLPFCQWNIELSRIGMFMLIRCQLCYVS